MTSIFRLDCIRVYDTKEHLYRDVSYSILGYYSTLDKALVAMRLNNKEAFDIECIYAYLIKELAIDGAIGTTDWLSLGAMTSKANLLTSAFRITTSPTSSRAVNQKTFDSKSEASWKFWREGVSTPPSWRPFHQPRKTVFLFSMSWMTAIWFYHWMQAPSTISILRQHTHSPSGIRWKKFVQITSTHVCSSSKADRTRPICAASV